VSERERDWAERFPSHVACAWAGNTEAVARRHYLIVTEEHWKSATGAAATASLAVPPAQETAEIAGKSAENAQVQWPPRDYNLSKKARRNLRVDRGGVQTALQGLAEVCRSAIRDHLVPGGVARSPRKARVRVAPRRKGAHRG
jgi:hypothetical protein